MQVFKGLIALVLTAAAVFTTAVFYNHKTESAYIAKMEKQTLAETVNNKHLATKKSTSAPGQKTASPKL